MNALLVLYAGNLSEEAFESLVNGKNSLSLAFERSNLFPSVAKTVLLTNSIDRLPDFIGVQIEKRPSWTVKTMLDTIATCSEGFDVTYFAWADCPFLDPDLAGRLAERHLRYAAEYSYADGWPYGLAPELLSPGTAAILANILGDDVGSPVKRDTLFSVIQKDINAFDIETEISSVDMRCHRITLCADSKRNLHLLRRFAEDSIPDAAEIERIVMEKPDVLRTLPAFYPVQVYGGCPQSCAWCPWPVVGGNVTDRRDYMETGQFESLLNSIVSFSGDAVIDLSLWGEFALHPQKMTLIEMVLCRPELALIIETSGIGWMDSELKHCAELAHAAAAVSGRKIPLPPLSWIISLDASDPVRYKEIRGPGYSEANDCAKKLLALFPKDTYVQAVRTTGAEDDIERFYRMWKETAGSTTNVIIQKYDNFCGMLPRKQASDLSPVQRKPCWHIMRDMLILLDGTVPLCREQIADPDGGFKLGNAFTEPLELIWERGRMQYAEQAGILSGEKKYDSLCTVCDEYYTYNF
ncbi:MAG: spiro-SPASM protein [Treponema sp.]|nr:spiro-SPASM protein [Treponema sp.]